MLTHTYPYCFGQLRPTLESSWLQAAMAAVLGYLAHFVPISFFKELCLKLWWVLGIELSAVCGIVPSSQCWVKDCTKDG